MSDDEDFYLSDGEIDDIAQDSFMILDEVDEEGEVHTSEEDGAEVVEPKIDNEVVVERTTAIVDLADNYNKDRFTFSTDNDHPYKDIIESFEFQEEQLTCSLVVPIRILSETPLHVIETRVSLIKLLQILRKAREIAVDLLATANGDIHILSISTQEADYIIDLVILKTEVLLLNEIFINPKIVKIFSRAISQLSHLQRSLCLYVINMFDVEKAGELLFGGDHPSFEGILQRDFSVFRDKPKLRNLTTRPFSEETKCYSRSASHFLIDLYHDYKNQLLAKDVDKYKAFLDECRHTCKMSDYGQELEEFVLIEQRAKVRQKAEVLFLRKMFEWRQNLAKELQENQFKILPDKILLGFSSLLPMTYEDIINWGKDRYLKKYSLQILQMSNKIRKELRLPYINEGGKVKPAVYNQVYPKIQKSPKTDGPQFWPNKNKFNNKLVNSNRKNKYLGTNKYYSGNSAFKGHSPQAKIKPWI